MHAIQKHHGWHWSVGIAAPGTQYVCSHWCHCCCLPRPLIPTLAMSNIAPFTQPYGWRQYMEGGWCYDSTFWAPYCSPPSYSTTYKLVYHVLNKGSCVGTKEGNTTPLLEVIIVIQILGRKIQRVRFDDVVLRLRVGASLKTDLIKLCSIGANFNRQSYSYQNVWIKVFATNRNNVLTFCHGLF